MCAEKVSKGLILQVLVNTASDKDRAQTNQIRSERRSGHKIGLLCPDVGA